MDADREVAAELSYLRGLAKSSLSWSSAAPRSHSRLTGLEDGGSGGRGCTPLVLSL
jgi:hypothetical protein